MTKKPSYIDIASNTSWVEVTPLFSNCPVDKIMEEISTVEESFLEERNTDQYKSMKDRGVTGIGTKIENQKEWKAVTLFSSTGDYQDTLTQGILRNDNLETYKQSFRNIRKHKWTQIAPLMKNTLKWINNEIGQYLNLSYVKIAKLGPGGNIPLHTDLPNEDLSLLSTQNSYNMLNSFLVELNFPEGVKALHDGVEIPYKKGSIFFLNQSKSHSTVNNGNSTRYNLRIQGLPNRKFREAFLYKINELVRHRCTNM